MIHVESFDSIESMQEELHRRSADAMAGLARQQRDLTLGSYWVQFQFEDDEPLVIFGHVVDEDEWALNSEGYEGTAEEQRQAMNQTGLMFGRAASKHFPDPELGYTHKASAWPIEQRLFEMAQAVDWDIDRLPHPGKVLLEIAYQSRRAHALGELARSKGGPSESALAATIGGVLVARDLSLTEAEVRSVSMDIAVAVLALFA